MGEPLRVLIVEDTAQDAEFMVRELQRAGYTPDWVRVETESECLSRLDADDPAQNSRKCHFRASGITRQVTG